jgi:hypothetical protein
VEFERGRYYRLLTQRRGEEEIEFSRLRFEEKETAEWGWPEGDPTAEVNNFSFTDPTGQWVSFVEREIKKWEALDTG